MNVASLKLDYHSWFLMKKYLLVKHLNNINSLFIYQVVFTSSLLTVTPLVYCFRLNNHGVTGMICVDKHGLCLGGNLILIYINVIAISTFVSVNVSV